MESSLTTRTEEKFRILFHYFIPLMMRLELEASGDKL